MRSRMLVGIAFVATVLTGLSAHASHEDVARQLQVLCREHMQTHPLVPGIILSVRAPAIGLDFQGACGEVAFASGAPLMPDDAFRTASVTKTFTAALLVKLAEDGALDLDDPISTYLDPALLSRVHVLNGVSRGHLINIRQLLNHGSGLYDYASDLRWQAEVARDPQKTWTALELVDWAVTNGEPYFEPGSGYAYSDTGYVLASMIAERAGGLPLADAYRSILLPDVPLPQTFLEWHEGAPMHASPRAHQYAYVFDTTDWNPTFDTYGGGGLVSTAADLRTFLRALFRGEVFDDPQSLDAMLTLNPHASYGLGLNTRLIQGRRIWWHNGFFGAFNMYEPTDDISVSGSANQSESEPSALITSVMKILIAAGAAR